MPSNYGTRDYYAALDRDAPTRTGLQIDGPNKPFAVYPFGYFAMLACWIEGLHHFSDAPVFVFFGARCLSVLLLGISLVLVYATVRQLDTRPAFALLLTACVGFFPLTTCSAAAVQTDNLSFLLVSLAFYLALRARRWPGDARLHGLLGLTFSALLITKPHFFACVLAPVLPMLAVEWHTAAVPGRRRLKLAALLLVPALASGALYLATTWGTEYYYYPPVDTDDGLAHTLRWFQAACWDFYAGLTHETFWGRFGWHDLTLVIRGHRTQEVIRFVVQALAWVLLGLTLVRLEQVAARLLRLARRGRAWYAVRLALANPLINSYFLFTVLMFCLYIRIENRFGAQGRNWWPMLLPIFLVGINYAPRALSLRSCRRAFAALMLGGLVAYCALGSVYGLRAIERRYYPSPKSTSRAVDTVLPADDLED
jgi:4-amino-4-deoxy-L-arabinose transferase-like glycosyltransferase